MPRVAHEVAYRNKRRMTLAMASLIVLPILCTWISGNASYIWGALLLPVFWYVWLRLAGGKSNFVSLDPEIDAALTEACLSAGVTGVTFRKMESGDSSNYPRPFIVGSSVSLSRRVLREWSRPALVWMVRAGTLGEKRFARYLEPWILAIVIGGPLLMCYLERLHLERVYIVLPVAFLFGMVGLGSFINLKFQMAADLTCCPTDEDLAAAKEALSTAYFAQAESSFANRWLYSRRELSVRAKNLGITLEKGFKVASGAGEASIPTKE